MSAKEATARIKINQLLELAGWRFFADEQGKANIEVEKQAKSLINEKIGYADYVLLDEKGFSYVILEAKADKKHPLDGKEQARDYAKSLNVSIIILSNGKLHYLWLIEKDNPKEIKLLPSYQELIRLLNEHKIANNPAEYQITRISKTLENWQASPKPTANMLLLANIEIGADYIVLSKYPSYFKSPDYLNPKTRAKFIDENKLPFLRPYQIKAIQALQQSAQTGQTRYLFEMATGTGKTLVSAAIIRLFLKSGCAKRVLFLVDRLELENQADSGFKNYLKDDYICKIYKENRGDWNKAHIVISTVQSLLNKYQTEFNPDDFDLLISDEAHRSISGESRAVFEYFNGFKLGLTATPKHYLKNIDAKKLTEQDPRQLEMRQLLDTYRIFHCEPGNPTYSYGLVDGVNEGFLINPFVIDARTDITAQLLADSGYSILIKSEETESEDLFKSTDFEKKFFSPQTNITFCQFFLTHALRDPISNDIGKTIIFCVSQNHARKIMHILNEMAMQLFPNQYDADFAVQITSTIKDAQEFTGHFAHNKLRGKTKSLEDYQSSKARVCVTVGMMTTGYDCPDLLNIVLMRPIFSPTDFVQIKGRGTRKYVFEYENQKIDKVKFKLFDFFANYEFFETEFNYDEVLKLPRGTVGLDININQITKFELIINSPDEIKTVNEFEIGFNGSRIDNELFAKSNAQLLNEKLAEFVTVYQPEESIIPLIRTFLECYLFDKEFKQVIDTNQVQKLHSEVFGFNYQQLIELGDYKNMLVNYFRE